MVNTLMATLRGHDIIDKQFFKTKFLITILKWCVNLIFKTNILYITSS